MKVQSNITSNDNDSVAEESLSQLAQSSQVMKKQINLIDKLKKIIFPTMAESHVFHDQSSISENLKEYRKHEKFCDVTLVVEDKKFNVHRVILAASIPYFKSMFESNMIESNMKEITLQFDAELIETFINYAYGDVISINKDNAEDILMAAQFFQLDKIVDLCINFFIYHFHPSNILECYFMADRINCQHIKTEALNYVYQYFPKVVKHKSFLELSYDTVKKIVSSNDLCVDNESEVFEAIIQWIKHIPEERSKHMFNLLHSIRLLSFEPSYLITRVSEEELVVNDQQCRKLVDEAKNCLILPERLNNFDNFKLQKRLHSSQQCGLHAIDVSYHLSHYRINVTRVNIPIKRSWDESNKYSSGKRTISCVASSKTSLYTICLGLADKNNGYKNIIEVYDVLSKTSKSISPILHQRHQSGAVILDNYLYVCGGTETSNPVLSEWHPTNTIQRYCPANDKWELLPPMTTARVSPAVVASGECLFVIGGKTSSNTIDSMEEYNLLTGKWSSLTAIKKKKEHLAVSLKGKIYIIGRNAEEVHNKAEFNTLDVYNPEKKTWSSLASLDRGEIKFFLQKRNDLWAVGKDFIAVYNTLTNTWPFNRSKQLQSDAHYVMF